MALTGACYCSREDVKSSLDSAETARNNAQIDRAISAATNSVTALLRRSFLPLIATRYFPWPSGSGTASWVLDLDRYDLASVTALTAGGTTISASDYFLEPVNDGPPYDRIEIDLASSASFSSNADTFQRSIAVAGTFIGCPLDTASAGATAEALDASETGVDVTDSASVGVGDLILVDSEYLAVVDKNMLTTGQTLLTTALTASAASVAVNVTDGTAFTVGETILLESERMLVVDIAGNVLTVKRAWDGTVLASHATGVTIYAPRTLTVQRGARGSIAATHSTSATVYRHVVPALVRQLAIAESVNYLLQEGSGYGRTVGSNDNVREFWGRGLQIIRAQAVAQYGRTARAVAV